MGVESELFKMIDVSIAPLQAQIDALTRRVAILEERAFPPKPAPPPAFKPWLAVKDGAFYDRDKLFRNCGVNLVGEAAMATDAIFQQEMDRIQAAGVRFLRGLHIAVDDKDPNKISQYQPTLAEWRNGFKYWDRLVAETRKREMICCITLHHRQRLTISESDALGVTNTLFSPQPVAGEIGASFLVIPQLEELVTDYCIELASRYKSDPNVVFIIANEKPRYPGYHYLDRNKPSDINKTYRSNWFSRFDAWQKALGLPDAETRAHHYAEFQAWNACNVYGRMIDALRAAGITQLIATTNGLGDCRMDILPILAHPKANFISYHAYGYIGPNLPNPFIPNDVRELASIEKAIRVNGFPVVLDEHANVDEGKQTMFPGYAEGPLAAADAGFDVNCHYAAFQGTPGWGKVYNGFDVAGFEAELKAANAHEWVTPDRTYHKLTYAEVFGERVKVDGTWKENPPPVVGCGHYGTDGVELPDEVLAWK